MKQSSAERLFDDAVTRWPDSVARQSQIRTDPIDVDEREPAARHYLARLFDTPGHRHAAGQLGIWLFLAAHIIFYSGLFCLYAVSRAHRHEVFEWGRYFINSRLGTASTLVMLLSSLTAAYALRCAQLAQRVRLVMSIGATLVCAFGFLGIKAVEYSAKNDEGLLPGRYFGPRVHLWEVAAFRRDHPASSVFAEQLHARAFAIDSTCTNDAAACAQKRPTVGQLGPLVKAGVLGPVAVLEDLPSQPRNAHVFFGLFFLLTGLHAVHLLFGICAWAWLLVNARNTTYGPRAFGPIDYVALHWHMLTVIWIYLFPLLYLIQ